jgi:hypothetical protein
MHIRSGEINIQQSLETCRRHIALTFPIAVMGLPGRQPQSPKDGASDRSGFKREASTRWLRSQRRSTGVSGEATARPARISEPINLGSPSVLFQRKI